MKLPPYIKIAGYDIQVVELKSRQSIADGEFGDFSIMDGRIRIDTRPTCKFMVLDTLVHEINHAIYEIYHIKDSDKEESTVRVMATAWVQIYRDNPDLLNYIYDICT